MYGLIHGTGREPYDRHHLAHACRVESVLHTYTDGSCTTIYFNSVNLILLRVLPTTTAVVGTVYRKVKLELTTLTYSLPHSSMHIACYSTSPLHSQKRALITMLAVNVHPDNMRRTNERQVYHAACENEYRP